MTSQIPPSMVLAADVPSARIFPAFSAGLSGKSFLRMLCALAALVLFGCSSLLAQTSFGTIAVGTASASQNVTVTAQFAGTVSTVDVLTLGQSGLDYAAAASGTCANANLAVGNTCTVPVTFTPAAPGARPGAVLLLDSTGNRIGVSFLAGSGSGGLGAFLPGTMQTIAGDGAWTSVLDGNLATQADLDLPEGEVLDGDGNLYIADSAHNRVREVSASTGKISTLAGNGNPAYTGDGGLAINATLNTPTSVALDGAGDLYIADSGNHVIRRIVLATGIIATFAGNGSAGDAGDGGPATSASLNNPLGVTADAAGDLYIADSYNHKIREVNSAGTINTIAGNGTTQGNGAGSYSGDGGPATLAGLNYPYAVALDNSGNLYIPDSANNRIRVVNASTQIITTFAGNGIQGSAGDGGAATQANLYSPSGVAFDPAGNLYIADTQNNRIRKVSAGTGTITTVAGNGIGLYAGDNTSAYAAGLYGPYGLEVDPDGNLLIADYFDHRIRRIQVNLATFKLTTPVRQGDKSPTQQETLENDGTAALNLTALTPDSNSALDPTVTTCVTTTPLATDTDCVLGAQFAPNTSGNPLTATITTTANSDNSPLLIQITGDATAVNSTTTALLATPSPANFGQTVALQATVTTGSGTGALTGTVSFSDGSKTIVSGMPISSSGTASYSTNNLAVGLHSLTASYSGDTGHFASTSTPPTSETVNEATSTTLTSSANPSGVGAAVTFTAVVTAPNGGGVIPNGSVNFLDAGTVLGTATLSASGVATFTTSSLSNGQHTITAAYGGDAANYILGSTSNAIAQSVQAPSTTAVTSSPNPSGYGVAVTFVATVTPGGSVTPTGSVSFIDNGAQIGSGVLSGSPATASFTTSALAAGQHSITAQYLGSSGNGASTSPPFTQTVSPVQTATTVTAAPNPGIAGRGVTLTASIKALQGATIPVGSVTFTDGGTVLGTATVNSAGLATITSNLSVGQHAIVASYAGSANDGSSVSAAFPLTVQLATTQVVATVSPNPALVLAQVLFNIKVTGNGGIPTGPVTLIVDGKSSATASLDATGAATIPFSTLGVGTHVISVSYAGDSNDAASSSTPLSEVIQPIPTATALGVTTTGAGSATQQTVLVSTVIGVSGPVPTGTVQFLNGSSVIGSSGLDSTGVATLVPNLPTGTYSIVAEYSGDAIHSPSTSQPATLSTAASTFSMNLNPPSITLKTGQNQTITVSIDSVNQATDTISLGCANLPAAVNCHFAANDLKLVAGGSATTQLTIDTNNPLSGGATASVRKPDTAAAPLLAGLSLPLAGFLGWLLWRARRRAQRWLVLVLLAAVSLGGLALSGCGGFSQNTAAPGTYTIQVTGVGTQSNQTHYVNFTLTITQ